MRILFDLQIKMVADVYSHIIDDDRRINAQRFEEQFYHNQITQQVDEMQKDIEQTEPEVDQEMILKLLAKPEMATLLKTLAQSL